MVKQLVKFFTSMRLTVVLLCLSILLVFIGTLAQVHEGLYLAQARYFKSWFIVGPIIASAELPIILPGGYLLGTLLIVNLLSAHIARFAFTWKKAGIHLTHGGLIFLLIGQLLTDVLSTESALQLAEGETKNYSVDFHANELVIVDPSDANHDQVSSIPEHRLAGGGEIRDTRLPVAIKVLKYWPNADLFTAPVSNSIPIAASQGIGPGLHLVEREPVVTMDARNIPAALVEVLGPQGSLGSWLVTSQSSAKQEFTVGGKTYYISLRFTRHYKPFQLKLLEFTHEKYRGTDKPRNFASRVRVQQPATGEDREVVIYMNNPLRYGGETYYQSSFAPDNDQRMNKITILQVVRNPSWLTPYFACAMMSLGMLVQFLMHLVGFVSKRRLT
jgi:ResB-like family